MDSVREADRLRARLETLLEEARRNEEKLARFDEFERRLMATRSFPAVVAILLDEYRQAFALDAVQLYWIDREGDVARLYETLGQAVPSGLNLVADLADIRLPGVTLATVTLLHRRDCPEWGDLDPSLASMAVLPLQSGGESYGALFFASRDPERYSPDSGTRFLERLASVAALCLDNALAHERLRHAGLTDALTGVYNRRYFEDRCRTEVADALRHRRALSCMFLDLDHFKRINDTHGHRAGDAVLQAAARTIQRQLRTGDTLARYGGEEFVALLPHTNLTSACQIAERIRLAVAAHPCAAEGKTINVTLSIGVAELDSTISHLDEAQASLIAVADAGVYLAKRNGRNRVATVGPSVMPVVRPSSVGKPRSMARRPLFSRIFSAG